MQNLRGNWRPGRGTIHEIMREADQGMVVSMREGAVFTAFLLGLEVRFGAQFSARLIAMDKNETILAEGQIVGFFRVGGNHHILRLDNCELITDPTSDSSASAYG